MADDKAHLDYLFIAIPELTFNVNLVETALRQKWITRDQYDKIKGAQATAKQADRVSAAAMKGDNLIARMMAVGSELLTVSTVDVFRRHGLLSETEGHALRLAIRSLNAATRGGLPRDASQIFSRLSAVIGVNVSLERIDMWRSMGLISASDAERWRGYLAAGTAVQASLAKAVRAKSILDALILLGELPMDRKLIAGMVRAGILTPRLGRVYNSLLDFGTKEWKVIQGAKAATGFRQRLMLVLAGSFNTELLNYLVTTKVISREAWALLQIAEPIARQVNDKLLEDLTRRRYRVRTNEAPIKTFARASRKNDGDLLRLLADAAQESRKEAAALAAMDGIGGKTRARQYRLAARGLHQSMRAMWEGVGYLTIWGEREVAEAAAESALAMQRQLFGGKWAQLGDSLLWQSKAGVDSYISRAENTLELSRRVYKNMALWEGKIDQRINMSLLQGKSPKEIADDVFKFISPNVRGGASYAAMRLARTEINNSFHFSTIRYTRENPWITGYKWNLSGSHPRADICNIMAERDHDGIGDGCYKKANVPGKPHPHCFCYLTTLTMSEAEFVAAHNKGRFNSWYRDLDRVAAFDAPDSASAAAYAQRGFGNLVEELKNQ